MQPMPPHSSAQPVPPARLRRPQEQEWLPGSARARNVNTVNLTPPLKGVPHGTGER